MAELSTCVGTWEDLSAICGLSGNDLASAIEMLASHSLLQVSGFEEKSYSLHPLTYHFAISQAAQKTGTEDTAVKADG